MSVTLGHKTWYLYITWDYDSEKYWNFLCKTGKVKGKVVSVLN
jgi:hypothetical protein